MKNVVFWDVTPCGCYLALVPSSSGCFFQRFSQFPFPCYLWTLWTVNKASSFQLSYVEANWLHMSKSCALLAPVKPTSCALIDLMFHQSILISWPHRFHVQGSQPVPVPRFLWPCMSLRNKVAAISCRARPQVNHNSAILFGAPPGYIKKTTVHCWGNKGLMQSPTDGSTDRHHIVHGTDINLLRACTDQSIRGDCNVWPLNWLTIKTRDWQILHASN
jgi:hypothetical protein